MDDSTDDFSAALIIVRKTQQIPVFVIQSICLHKMIIIILSKRPFHGVVVEIYAPTVLSDETICTFIASESPYTAAYLFALVTPTSPEECNCRSGLKVTNVSMHKSSRASA